MGFTLFEFGPAGSLGDCTDRHLLVDASARTGTDSQPILEAHGSVTQYRFENENSMLAAWKTLVAENTPEIIFIATRDFPQCSQSECAGGAMLFVPVKRRQDLDRVAFHAHWLSHGPLIMEVIPGLLGYVQHHVTPSLYDYGISEYDGVARFWFTDIEEVAQLPLSQPEQFARIVADEASFLAHPIENYIGRRPES